MKAASIAIAKESVENLEKSLGSIEDINAVCKSKKVFQ